MFSSYRRLETAVFAFPLARVSVYVVSWLPLDMAFTSKITITAEQLAAAPQLEPAFEHLLRNSSTHESVISTLRANGVVDRDTFVNMFLTEEAVRLGF